MAFNILQWNCNGFYNNFEELKLLVHDYAPGAISLQETHFVHSKKPTLKNYKIFYALDNYHLRASGGAAVCVKEQYHPNEIDLDTDLQAVAVRLFYPIEFTICSLYLPPNLQTSKAEISNLINQLPTPFLLTGDFNAHSLTWGCNSTNTKGNIIETILSTLDLNLLNTGSYTHFSQAHNSYSAIDLSLCSPSLSPLFDWNVHPDLCNSDHFPIILSFLSNQKPRKRRPQWISKAADWESFQNLVSLNLDNSNYISPTDRLESLNSVIIKAATESIPRTSNTIKKAKPPWWNKEIAIAIKNRKKALRTFNKNICDANKIAYSFAKAKARRLIRLSKKLSWQNFVSSIDLRTAPTQVWSQIRKISGKFKNNTICSLKVNDILITDPLLIAEELGKTFAQISSSENYSPNFLTYKQHCENFDLIDYEDSTSSFLNIKFTLIELESTLYSFKGSSPGPDDITYQMLQNLPIDGKLYLLKTYNELFFTHTFPSIWKESIVIPIEKSNKNPLLPSNKRPISLTCCPCKAMEKMINRRLVWYLESIIFFSSCQNGFRKYRNTMDNLVSLETAIQDAFACKQHLVAIFFDLEKAYDMTWQHNIIKTLHDVGVRGNILYFIKNFMSKRKFRVCIGDLFSSFYDLENGVLQGSVLSVTLFLVGIRSIHDVLPLNMERLSYADDFVVYMRSSCLIEIETEMQIFLDNLSTWCDKTGFKFSPTKTKMVHFCKLKSCNSDPELFLQTQSIEVVEEHTFLGIIFEKKLTWVQYLKHLKSKASNATNIIKTLSSTSWGSDRKTLLTLHKTLVLSKIDYGSVLYSTGRKNLVDQLNSVNHLGVRLSTGAFRSSPTCSILAEAGIMPLKFRRENQVIQLGLRIASIENHPLKNFDNDSRIKSSKSFKFRCNVLLEKYGINTMNIFYRGFHSFPPWCISKPKIDYTLGSFKKSAHNAHIFRAEYVRLCNCKYKNHFFIYTDGSKQNDLTGLACYSEKFEVQVHLPNFTSIFVAELLAILHSLEKISSSDFGVNFVICSDSKSSLQSIENIFSEHPIVQKIHKILKDINDQHRSVVFLWIPSHIGILGNEIVDNLAKMSIQKPITNMKFVISDLKSKLKAEIFRSWETEWQTIENNKLRVFKTDVSAWESSCRRSRKESVVLCRLRIGHCNYTHKHLFVREDPPNCEICKTQITVNHFLFECSRFRNERAQFRIDDSVLLDEKYLLHKNLFEYLKAIDVYTKI